MSLIMTHLFSKPDPREHFQQHAREYPGRGHLGRALPALEGRPIRVGDPREGADERERAVDDEGRVGVRRLGGLPVAAFVAQVRKVCCFPYQLNEIIGTKVP